MLTTLLVVVVLAALAPEAGGAEAAEMVAAAVTVADRAELLGFLGSARFESDYFEKQPVLITIADGRWEPKGSESLTLESVLSQPQWAYEAVGAHDGHHRSLVFRGGSFVPSAAAPGWRRGDPVGREDILDALRHRRTVIAHGAQLFLPTVTKLTLEMSELFRRIVNTNVYITAAASTESETGQDNTAAPPTTSMAAHNDIQCTLIFQVQGRKRWRLWRVPRFLLARSERETLGKTEARVLDEGKLGPPHMDVVLTPGQVLYVPRGVIHATSTALYHQAAEAESDFSGPSTSMHLTVGLEAGFGWTVEGFLGAGHGVMAASPNVDSANREPATPASQSGTAHSQPFAHPRKQAETEGEGDRKRERERERSRDSLADIVVHADAHRLPAALCTCARQVSMAINSVCCWISLALRSLHSDEYSCSPSHR
jgi:hypothetical protein